MEYKDIDFQCLKFQKGALRFHVIIVTVRTRFYIEKRRDGNGQLMGGPRPVFMSVSFSGNRLRIATGLKLEMHAWDEEKQKVKSSYPESEILNQWLEAMEDTAERIHSALSMDEGAGNPEEFLKQFRAMKPEYSGGFFSGLIRFIETNSSGWTTSTYRKVRTFYRQLREFEEQTGFRISFKKMDRSFLETFVTYFQEKGYRAATIRKSVNLLVWFLNWATEQGYNIYRTYRKFYRWLELPVDVSKDTIYLKWDELQKFRQVQPENRRMEWAGDMFFLMCVTGIRFSEIQSLKKGDIFDDRVIISTAGRQKRELPLNRYAKEIRQIYESRYYLHNAAFPPMSVVTMNKYLKRTGELAGLTRQVPAGNGMDELIPLYERITTGAAVHTFIANALKMEVSPEIIAEFTGVRQDARIGRIREQYKVEAIQKIG